MYCRNCGQPLNENQAICLQCGVEVGKGNTHCYNCGNPVNPEAAFCLSCGVSLNNNKNANQENKAAGDLAGYNKITIALVCFFLGGLGIHNFMMGENKKGIAKILLSFLCGIGGILALVDFIKILVGSYVVNTEKAF
jgi:uncharacterized membrane protein YvbJ